MPERVTSQTEMFVRNVEVPQRTKTYSPVSHGDIIDVLDESLRDRGLISMERRYTTAKDGREVFGAWILKKENESIEQFNVGDQALGINFVNSYNKNLKLSLAPGIITKICGNGAVSRESIAIFDRKHTGDIELEFQIFIQNVVQEMEPLYNNILTHFEKLKEVPVSKKIMSELAGRLFIEQNVLNTEQMNILKKEIERPSFHQFTSESGYSFYQHVTYAIRNSHPADILEKYINIHEFINQNLL